MAPHYILLPGDLLPIRISHMLKNNYSFPFYHFIMFCILLSNVHAISMLLYTCTFRFPQFVFIATFPLFAVNVSQRQFQSLAWSSASLWHYNQETRGWFFTAPPPCSVPKWIMGKQRLYQMKDIVISYNRMDHQLKLACWHFSFQYWTRGTS